MADSESESETGTMKKHQVGRQTYSSPIARMGHFVQQFKELRTRPIPFGVVSKLPIVGKLQVTFLLWLTICSSIDALMKKQHSVPKSTQSSKRYLITFSTFRHSTAPHKSWSPMVAGDEGLYLPSCQTNYVIVNQ